MKSGCLRIVNQSGGSTLPAFSLGWAGEQALDLDGQLPSVTGCTGSAVADVAAVADPNTGLRSYGPTSSRKSSWQQYGGTSLSAPIVAGVYALSGNTASYANALPYANPAAFNDVTSGSNGTCPTSQWCTARAGWDGPTGLGTPNGTRGF